MLRTILSIYLLIFSSITWAGAIQGIRSSTNDEGTRLVFDLNAGVDYQSFTLSNPERLVIDLKNFHQQEPLTIPSLDETPVKAIRYAAYNRSTLRVVLDLTDKVSYQTQTLAPDAGYPHRLVIDIASSKKKMHPALEPKPTPKTEVAPPTPQAVVQKAEPKPEAAPPAPQTVIQKVETKPEVASEPKVIKSTKSLPRRDIVVAIDAGHGGQDSGALGRRGTKEKDVVLAIAKRLAKLVDKEPGMRAYLTRDKDYFISLRERIRRARDHGADMFISVHADAFKNPQARGSSVYVLSQRGASSEAAQILADRENAADLAGGISLEDKDQLLASVLLDLSQTASLEASLEVGNTVLSGLKRVGHVHKKQVESAAFVVLKSPDIPSLLVETAFISNPEEEKKLISSSHQDKLAKAMMVGIRRYFQQNPIPGSVTEQQHIVAQGDTLSTIAQRYQVSMADIKSSNKLSGSTLRIGEVLRIP